MADEPIVLTHQVEPRVESVATPVERPAPSPEKEHMADGLFSADQEQALATVMAVQTGLALAHHILQESMPGKEEEEDPRKRKLTPPGKTCC